MADEEPAAVDEPTATDEPEAAATCDDCEAAWDEAEAQVVRPDGLGAMVTAWAKLSAPVESLMATVL